VNRHSGILVKGTDPETLAAAITEVLEDPDLSATLSRNGRVVAENSSWPNVLTRWRELFDAILDPNGAAAEDRSREALLQREA
jgi:glycosyltransferase involved in cell wall biosynthesis